MVVATALPRAAMLAFQHSFWMETIAERAQQTVTPAMQQLAKCALWVIHSLMESANRVAQQVVRCVKKDFVRSVELA